MSEQEISEEETLHVAHLARLGLSGAEVKSFSKQLSAILQHAKDIATLDLDDVVPTKHAISLMNVMREDTVGDSLDRDEVLASAPEAQSGMFVVPKILGES